MADAPRTNLELWFDQLLTSDAAERAALLAMRTPTERALLQRLLEADSESDASLERLIGIAASRADSVDLSTTTQLGPWRLLRQLGAGGMGVVFLAERTADPSAQPVAIKLLRGFPTADAKLRLRTERQVLAQLDHPAIARLLGGGETDDGQPYLVMEYVQGQSLTAHCATLRLDRAARVALIMQLCLALAHAHQRLVIHRDLKPANVLVSQEGALKLLDFGVAKLLDLQADPTATSTRVWTPGYASPEQQAGKAVTTATDVYALGVLLQELLCGMRPDGRANQPPLPAVAIDPDLAAIVRKATRELAAERYLSADALHADLSCWRNGLPVQAARDGHWYLARKFVLRHRVGVALSALAIAATVEFVVLLTAERDRALRSEKLAMENAQRSQVQQRFLAGFFLGTGGKTEDGQPITGMALLARAAQKLETELAGEPRAYAETATLVAQAYMNALQFAQAERYAERAVAHTPTDERAATQAARLRLWARNLVALDRDSEAAAIARRGIALIADPPTDAEQALVGAQLRITLAQALPAGDSLRAARLDAKTYALTHVPAGTALRGMALAVWAAQLQADQQYPALVQAREAALAEWQADPAAFASDIAHQQTNLASAQRLIGELSAAKATIVAAETHFAEALRGGTLSGQVSAALEHAKIALLQQDVPTARDCFARAIAITQRLDQVRSVDSYLVEVQLLWVEGEKGAAKQALAALRTRTLSVAQQSELAELEAQLGQAR